MRRRTVFCRLAIGLAFGLAIGAPALADDAQLDELRERTTADWLALSVADLGRVWWTLNDAAAGNPDPPTLAVVVNGRAGFIDTSRAGNAPVDGVPEVIPSDLHQAYPGGNFAILVSGDPPPVRPRNNPLGWRGFVWEGFVPPDTPLADVFDDVAVMPRSQLRFDQSVLRQIAPAPDSAVPAGLPPLPPTANSPQRQPSHPAIATPSDAPASRRQVALAPPGTTTPSREPASAGSSAPASRAPDTVTPTPPATTRTIKARIGGPSARRDSRLARIAQVNVTLRRQVAYMEALLLGPELGRSIPLQTQVSDLVGILTGPDGKPRRNVFLRIATSRGPRVGRVVTLSRYPLYRIGSAGRGSHQVLLDLEVRGPDGTTLLGRPTASRDGNGPAIAVTVPDGPVQFRGVTASTTLESLGVRAAVWWPIRGQLGGP